MATDHRADYPVYVGLCLVTLATIVYEIALTRIFSVTMWYHFAFVAISVAMLGNHGGRARRVPVPGSVLVGPCRPRPRGLGAALRRGDGRKPAHAAVRALRARDVAAGHLLGRLHVRRLAVPFAFSGICVTLALTRFPAQLGSLYGVDLLGAATGCAFVILALDATDGPTTVVATALIACVAAVVFLTPTGRVGLRAAALVTVILMAGFIAVKSEGNTSPVRRCSPRGWPPSSLHVTGQTRTSAGPGAPAASQEPATGEHLPPLCDRVGLGSPGRPERSCAPPAPSNSSQPSKRPVPQGPSGAGARPPDPPAWQEDLPTETHERRELAPTRVPVLRWCRAQHPRSGATPQG